MKEGNELHEALTHKDKDIMNQIVNQQLNNIKNSLS